MAVPVEMEKEFHQKVGEYLSVNLDEIDETSVSPVTSHNLGTLSQDQSGIPSSVLIHDPPEDSSPVLSHGPSDVSSSILPHALSYIPSDVISNDDE